MYDSNKPMNDMSDMKSVSGKVGTQGALYRLELRSLPHEIPIEIRLRRALKVLLRVYHFRVTDYRLASPAALATPATPPPASDRAAKGLAPRGTAAMPEIRQKRESHNGQ